jgi:anaerobic C4-dicarboxylate transporter
MKKVWIFLLIAVVLIAWTLVRERFEPTPSIQAPPYDKADKIRIFGLLDNADQAFLMTKVKAQDVTNAGVFETLSTKA